MSRRAAYFVADLIAVSYLTGYPESCKHTVPRIYDSLPKKHTAHRERLAAKTCGKPKAITLPFRRLKSAVFAHASILERALVEKRMQFGLEAAPWRHLPHVGGIAGITKIEFPLAPSAGSFSFHLLIQMTMMMQRCRWFTRRIALVAFDHMKMAMQAMGHCEPNLSKSKNAEYGHILPSSIPASLSILPCPGLLTNV